MNIEKLPKWAIQHIKELEVQIKSLETKVHILEGKDCNSTGAISVEKYFPEVNVKLPDSTGIRFRTDKVDVRVTLHKGILEIMGVPGCIKVRPRSGNVVWIEGGDI